MTGDFTNLDPNIIADFWIYFIASFVIGLILGFLIAKCFFHKESRIVNQVKERCNEQQTEMANIKEELEKKKDELAALKEDVSKNKLYWAMKERETKPKPADEALFNGLFQQKD